MQYYIIQFECLPTTGTDRCPPQQPAFCVAKPIGGLNGNGCYTMGYALDIAILIRGKFLNTVSELLQEALSMVQQ
jgi:hypothetical protein